MKQNKLTHTDSQEKKLVNIDSSSIKTLNVVSFNEFRAKSAHKAVSKNYWKSCDVFKSFLLHYPISYRDAHVILGILSEQDSDGFVSHSAIASFIGGCPQTVRRTILKLVKLRLIDYIPGSRCGKFKLFSQIKFLVPLPPKKSLKSFARNKPQIAKHMDMCDIKKISSNIANSNKKHAMKNEDDKNQNVYLLIEHSSKENTIVNNTKIYKKKLELFEVTSKMRSSAKEKYDIQTFQFDRNIEKYKKRNMLAGLKTVEMWEKHIDSLMKKGREMGYDYTPKEMNWYSDKKVTQYNTEVYEHTQKIAFISAKESEDMTLTHKGISTMIAKHYGDTELRKFTDLVKSVEVVVDKNRLILYVGTPNYVPPKPHWEDVVKHYHKQIDNFRYEIKR